MRYELANAFIKRDIALRVSIARRSTWAGPSPEGIIAKLFILAPDFRQGSDYIFKSLKICRALVEEIIVGTHSSSLWTFRET